MSRTKVTVTGDITIDWKIAQSRTSRPTSAPWDPDFFARAYRQFGGARLLGELIQEGATEDTRSDDVSVRIPDKPTDSLAIPGRQPFWHSYTVCAEYPLKEGSKKDTELVWRVKDFLGIDRQIADDICKPVPLMPDEDGRADIIVLDDAKHGFREMHGPDISGDGRRFDIWPKSLLRQSPHAVNDGAWLLFKFDRPDFDPPGKDQFWLWDYLGRHFDGRLIVVVNVDDLRTNKLEISRGLSWERTAEDVMKALAAKKEDWRLDRCAHVVVSMYTEGAMVFSPQKPEPKATLYYDPTSIEGTWSNAYPGKMIGRTQCLVAAIALQMIRSAENRSDIRAGVHAGLTASRLLHERGFEASGRTSIESGQLPETLNFPKQRLMKAVNEMLGRPPDELQSSFHEQQLTVPEHRNWSILGMRYVLDHPDGKQNERQSQSILELAREIVERGRRDDQWDVPVCKFGELIAVDREEIEGLRTIRELMQEYRLTTSESVPLSIAVFGSPGSGKSFAIREIAASLGAKSPGQRDLTFNLSQFTDAQAVFSSLHQVRDEALRGGEPLVFWDEFDSDTISGPLGWLRYFLSPMQDGQFTVGPVTHNVGRAIFIFAGGTRETMQKFEDEACLNKAAKGPDFLSRLKGYLNVAGLDHSAKGFNASAIIRRALLLRSYLLQTPSRIVVAKPVFGSDVKVESWNENVKIDGGVLDAFLLVPSYKYGARSMRSIVKMSTLSDRAMFARSSLPTEAALDLHVSGDEFMKIVRGEAPKVISTAVDSIA